MAVAGDGVDGVLLLQSIDQALHQTAQFGGVGCGQILLFKGVLGEMIELVGRPFGHRRGQIVINDFPAAIAIGREVIAAVGRVRVMHQKGFAAARVGLAGEEAVERRAVHHMRGRRAQPNKLEQGGKEVVHGGLLGLDGPGGDGKALLARKLRPRPGPGGDEGDPHPAFIVRALASPQRRGASHGVLVP